MQQRRHHPNGPTNRRLLYWDHRTYKARNPVQHIQKKFKSTKPLQIQEQHDVLFSRYPHSIIFSHKPGPWSYLYEIGIHFSLHTQATYISHVYPRHPRRHTRTCPSPHLLSLHQDVIRNQLQSIIRKRTILNPI